MEKLVQKIINGIRKVGFTLPSLGLLLVLLAQMIGLLAHQERWALWINLGLIGLTLISSVGIHWWKRLKAWAQK